MYSNTALDPAAPDGNIDYIVFIPRILGAPDYNGVANVNVSSSTDLINGTNIYNLTTGHHFTTAVNSSEKFINTFWHEMMHTVYNCPHTWNANDVVGNYSIPTASPFREAV